MITLIYTVKPEEKQAELEWLKLQKIYPSVEDAIDWSTGKIVARFGMIVSPEAALPVKLRHKLDVQLDYRKKW